MTVTINDIPVVISSGSTVRQACAQVGVDVPRFCYHSGLGIAGNCRRCLVEIAKSPKPQAACALPVLDKRVVYTETPRVKKAREGVLEFLLIHHPLDCPICDQGGECDLQDNAMLYGSDRSRFVEVKRSVEDKSWGPLIKTVRTRCIQCTRCVRFASESLGASLGALGRGSSVEIGHYVSSPQAMIGGRSGNVVDLCPVGALTMDGGHAFRARPWEIDAVSVDTYDFTDSALTPIRVQTLGRKVCRVLPRPFGGVEWLSDKARHGLLVTQSVRQLFSFGVPRSKKQAQQLGIFKQPRLSAVFGGSTPVELVQQLRALGLSLQSTAPVSFANRLGLTSDSSELQSVVVLGQLSTPTALFEARALHLLGVQFVRVGTHLQTTFPMRHLTLGLRRSSLDRMSLNGICDLWVETGLLRHSSGVLQVALLNQMFKVRQLFWRGTRSNDLYFTFHSGALPYASKLQESGQLLINVTQKELSACGVSVNELLGRASHTLVFTSVLEPWMSKAELVVYRPSGLEKSYTFVGDFGTCSTTPVVSSSADDLAWVLNSISQSTEFALSGDSSMDLSFAFFENTRSSTIQSATLTDTLTEGHPLIEWSSVLARTAAVNLKHYSNFDARLCYSIGLKF